jgi:hypothetical protein
MIQLIYCAFLLDYVISDLYQKVSSYYYWFYKPEININPQKEHL